MTVDISKIKPGDKVTVEMIAGDFRTDTWLISHAEKSEDSWRLPISAIMSHTPAPREIKVGDMVTWGNGSVGYVVGGLYKDRAWLPELGGDKLVSVLRHYDPDQR